MKNKHLILLFLATAAVGLLARRTPWFKANVFSTNLIELDTAQVTQISVFRPGQPELLLERTETGWVVAQELRAVHAAPEQVAPMLELLRAVRSLRIVQTERPDTFGFSEKAQIKIRVYQDKNLLEQFDIGNTTTENGQAATYIHLSRHEGIYLVQQHLRGIFDKKMADFRKKRLFTFDPASVHYVVFSWYQQEGPDLQFPIYRNDTTGQWEPLGEEPPVIADDTIRQWLGLFQRLNDADFADHFDESRSRETLLAQVELGFTNGDSLLLRLFHPRPPELPEEITTEGMKALPLYILHASQNPVNFFAPADTATMLQVFFRFMPPVDTSFTQKWKERKR